MSVTSALIDSKTVKTAKGTLTCGVFPRDKGRAEIVCSLVKPGGAVTFASHGTYPSSSAARSNLGRVVEYLGSRYKNPVRKRRRNPIPAKQANITFWGTIGAVALFFWWVSNKVKEQENAQT